MELQQIRYLIALSQELHFQRAAKKMKVTQPTLSQQIKKLEQEFGTTFFERTTRGVHLTAAGRKFLPFALDAIDTLGKGLEEIIDKEGPIRARLRLAAIPTICPYVLPHLIVRLKKDAPGLSLQLYEETTENLLSHLKQGSLDAGILSLPIDEAGIVAKPVCEEPFYLGISRSHPLAKKKTVDLKDIEKENLIILQEGHCFADQALNFCKRSRKDDQVIFEGGSLTSVLQLASSGEGITFVPEMAVDRSSFPKLAFVPFAGKKPTRAVVFAWRSSTPLSRAHRYLLTALEKHFETVKK